MEKPLKELKELSGEKELKELKTNDSP